MLSVVAAATEYDYNSKDDDPGAVIIEKMAEAVVIHICSSRGDDVRLTRLFL